MKRIAVFCGSSTGFNPIYAVVAFQTGAFYAKKKIRIIFGGGKIGLMGNLADGAMESNGEVIGVIPKFLNAKEIRHDDITHNIEVDSMHERKMRIYDMSDGFVALPGGYGTMDELFEIITWAQLGLHQKPIGILNVRNFYTNIKNQLDMMVTEGFLKSINREMIIIEDRIEVLHEKMCNFRPIAVPKWIEDSET